MSSAGEIPSTLCVYAHWARGLRQAVRKIALAGEAQHHDEQAQEHEHDVGRFDRHGHDQGRRDADNRCDKP